MRKTLKLNSSAAAETPAQVEGQPQAAANDDAPKAPRARLQMPNFTASLAPVEIKIGEGSDGKPYMALKGCEMVLPNGQTAVRTAMAFDEAFDAVRAAIDGLQEDIVATLAYQGSTMKVVGLVVDGEMKMFERKQLPNAA